MKKILTFLLVAIIVVFGAFLLWVNIFPEQVLKRMANSERDKAGLELFETVVNGMRVKYLAGGKGEILLLIHGFGANKDNWTRVSKFLTPHFKVIALDLIGFGESDRPKDAGYSIMDQMERVRAFADKLNLKKIHLGGSSMGGHISATFAAIHPKYIKSLWLLDPGGVYSSEKSEMYRLIQKGQHPLIVKDAESFNKLMEFVFYKKPYIPSSVVEVLAKEAIRNKPLNEVVFKAIMDKPVELDKILVGSDIKTLVVWGKNDRVIHYSGANILKNIMKNTKVTIFENTGHLPMIEKPEETAKDFLKFHKIN
ncbi:MAG: alpha/beta hydrolase [Desulfobacterales bacterium]|nr:alpha/beta hydrolase [Desulfobacterales bacterium]MCP4159624.1 alpha/beta hydrolase [Deltaproteobacteria bacterium]